MTDPTDRLIARSVRPIDEFHDEMMAKAEAGHQKRLAAQSPAGRAAVRCPSCEHEARYHDADGRCWFTVEQGVLGRDAVCSCQLRRMADETPAAEAQPFVPPAHYRRDDGVDCCVHTIPVGPNSCPACRELADDEPAAGPTIVDQVVAALQAKAQALSVEAEEEMRRDLEEQAQVWHEAADLARRTGRKAARSAQPAAGAPQDGARP